MRPYYAAVSVREEALVERIRAEVWNLLDPPGGYERVDPHITVHPGFSCGNRTAARVAGVLSYAVGETVETTGLSVHPDVDRPAVVKLDLDADLSMYRESITSQVEDAGGSIDRDPVPPHLTLFKAADAGEDPGGPLIGDKDRLRRALGDHAGVEFEVAGFRLEKRT